jgi:hypothetical protein
MAFSQIYAGALRGGSGVGGVSEKQLSNFTTEN